MKYNKILWDLLQTSRLATRAAKLAHQVTSRQLQMQQEEYKKIDKAATKYK